MGDPDTERPHEKALRVSAYPCTFQSVSFDAAMGTDTNLQPLQQHGLKSSDPPRSSRHPAPWTECLLASLPSRTQLAIVSTPCPYCLIHSDESPFIMCMHALGSSTLENLLKSYE